jgi:hypothetical protein
VNRAITPVEHQVLDRLSLSRKAPLSAVMHRRHLSICLQEMQVADSDHDAIDWMIAAAVHSIRIAELIGGAK